MKNAIETTGADAETKCSCGQPLPVHIAQLASTEDNYEHVCSCKRVYRVTDGRFVPAA